MLNIQSSENPSRGISVTDEKGNREEILRISCSIRPASSLHLSVDVLNNELVAENLAEVQSHMARFVAEAFGRAAEMGLPVPIAGGDGDA